MLYFIIFHLRECSDDARESFGAQLDPTVVDSVSTSSDVKMSVKMSDLFAETKLFRVVLYLGGLVACLLYVLWKAFNASRSVDRVSKKLLLLPLISLLSLAVTWREIILFINEKAKGYPDLKTTFKQAEIFVEVMIDCFALEQHSLLEACCGRLTMTMTGGEGSVEEKELSMIAHNAFYNLKICVLLSLTILMLITCEK